MANQQRGECNLTLNECNFVLRPTFDAIARFESRASMGITDFWHRVAEDRFLLTHAVIWLEECLRAGGGKLPDKFGEKLRSLGMTKIMLALVQTLNAAIVGDPPEEPATGEDQAATGN